jgi:hypothetical protein
MTFTFWHVLAVFVLGLFIGSTLGILAMCILAMCKKKTGGKNA